MSVRPKSVRKHFNINNDHGTKSIVNEVSCRKSKGRLIIKLITKIVEFFKSSDGDWFELLMNDVAEFFLKLF